VANSWWWRFIRKEWRANRVAHLLVTLVLVAGFTLYGLYGAWTTVLRQQVNDIARKVELPVPLMVFYPDWTLKVARPDLSIEPYVVAPVVADLVHHATCGLYVRLYAEGDAVDVWGIDPADEWLGRALGVSTGRGLKSPDDALVAASLVGQLDNLDALTLTYADAETGRTKQVIVNIVGIFDDRNSELYPDVVMSRDRLKGLVGVNRSNAAWLWPPAAIVASMYHQKGEDGMAVTLHLLRRNLPSVRAPAYPLDKTATHEKGSVEMQYGGRPAPFMQLASPIYWYEDMTAGQLGQLNEGTILALSGLVGLMFGLIVLAITLIVLVIVVDRQRTIGIYAVVGLRPGDIARLFQLHLVWDAVMATGVGYGAIRLLFDSVEATGGQAMVLPMVTLILWVAAACFFVWWGGHVALVLSNQKTLRSHLRGDMNFDWWALIRIGG